MPRQRSSTGSRRIRVSRVCSGFVRWRPGWGCRAKAEMAASTARWTVLSSFAYSPRNPLAIARRATGKRPPPARCPRAGPDQNRHPRPGGLRLAWGKWGYGEVSGCGVYLAGSAGVAAWWAGGLPGDTGEGGDDGGEDEGGV